MGLTFKQTDKLRSRADVILDAPENRNKKRKIMRARAFSNILSNIFIWSGLAFVVYCTSLYIGAFIDVREVAGSSQLVRIQKVKATVDQMPRIKQRTLISPIIERLASDRIYMRRGQSILATYSLPEKSKLNLTIKQCKTAPVLEIFWCQGVSNQNKIINNKTTGFVEFTAARPGFYHFNSYVVKTPNTVLNANFDYRVVWQRGGKRVR